MYYYYYVSLSAITSDNCMFSEIKDLEKKSHFNSFNFLFVYECHGLQMYAGATLINFMMNKMAKLLLFLPICQKKKPFNT